MIKYSYDAGPATIPIIRAPAWQCLLFPNIPFLVGSWVILGGRLAALAFPCRSLLFVPIGGWADAIGGWAAPSLQTTAAKKYHRDMHRARSSFS